MTKSLAKLNVRKDDGSGAFRVYAVFEAEGQPVFDVTKELEALDRQDKADGYETETGPRFGFGIHNALRAVEIHEHWCTLGGPTDKVRIPFRGSWRTFDKSRTRVTRTWSW